MISILKLLEPAHVQSAWRLVYRNGIPPEQASASVVPSDVAMINSVERSVYSRALVGVLYYKKRLFARAMTDVKEGRSWRTAFRGKRGFFWPSAQEQKELGFDDHVLHLVEISDPYEHRPILLKIRINHKRRSLERVEALRVGIVAPKTTDP